MTFDSAGAWYLVDFSSNSNVLAVKYFDSIIAPNSETIADYKRCNQPPCEPGNIGNLADSPIVQDLNGGFHVVYSVEIPGGGKIIYIHLERKKILYADGVVLIVIKEKIRLRMAAIGQYLLIIQQ